VNDEFGEPRVTAKFRDLHSAETCYKSMQCYKATLLYDQQEKRILQIDDFVIRGAGGADVAAETLKFLFGMLIREAVTPENLKKVSDLIQKMLKSVSC